MTTATLDAPSALTLAPAQAKPAINPWLIAITVTMATFMELLDTSIANVSLPHIAGGLATSYDESTWVLTSYLVANAVVLPLSAWLSRVFGRKRYYMTCVALFSVSSLLCGFAPSLALLIVFRVLQGIGGGGLAPVEQAILVDTFPGAKRAGAFALYSMAIVTAPAIGPILGGWITDSFSWRWVFFINVPIGLLSLLLTQPAGVRSAGVHARKSRSLRQSGQPGSRLRRHRAHRGRLRVPRSRARSRPARRLAREPASSRPSSRSRWSRSPIALHLGMAPRRSGRRSQRC